MELQTNEAELREELLPSPSRSPLEDPWCDPSTRNGASSFENLSWEQSGDLMEYLDLRNRLSTDRKLHPTVLGTEHSLVDQVRRNDAVYDGRATYCFAVLVYTLTVANLVWINPEIRLGYVLLAPLPFFLPFVIRWWWQKKHGQQRVVVSPVVQAAPIPVR